MCWVAKNPFTKTSRPAISTACVFVALPWPAEPLRCLERDLARERAAWNVPLVPLKRGVFSVVSVTSRLGPTSCSSSSSFSSSSSSSRFSPACNLVSLADGYNNDHSVRSARTIARNLWNCWASGVLQYLAHLHGAWRSSVGNHPVREYAQMRGQADGKDQRMK